MDLETLNLDYPLQITLESDCKHNVAGSLINSYPEVAVALQRARVCVVQYTYWPSDPEHRHYPWRRNLSGIQKQVRRQWDPVVLPYDVQPVFLGLCARRVGLHAAGPGRSQSGQTACRRSLNQLSGLDPRLRKQCKLRGVKEIADENAFALAMHVILGGMTMADKRLLLEETSAINAFMALNYGIEESIISRAHTAFMDRLHELAEGEHSTLVQEAFATLRNYCGPDLERKRTVIRLLYTLAQIDGEAVDSESDYGQIIARYLGLKTADVNECARVGIQAGTLLRQWAKTLD
jgi:uncharacterized tellurite resistance protein B-like protein